MSKYIKNKEQLVSDATTLFLEAKKQYGDNEDKIKEALEDVLNKDEFFNFDDIEDDEDKLDKVQDEIIRMLYQEISDKEKGVASSKKKTTEETQDYIREKLFDALNLNINATRAGNRSVQNARGKFITEGMLFRRGRFEPDPASIKPNGSLTPDNNEIPQLLLKVKGKQSNDFKRNFNYLLETIRSVYNQEDDDAFEFESINLNGILEKTTMDNLDKRESIYTYWEELHGKFPELIKECKELLKKLEKLNDVDELFSKDLNEYKQAMRNIDDINYIEKFTKQEVTIGFVEERAMKAINNFFKVNNMLPSLVDESDVGLQQQVVGEGGERKVMQEYTNEIGADKKEVQEIGVKAKKITLDPLAILYLERDLEGIAETFEDVDFEETVRDMFEYVKSRGIEGRTKEQMKEEAGRFVDFGPNPELKKPKQAPIELIEENDAEELIQKLMMTFEKIEDYNASEMYLPKFLFKTKELQEYLPQDATSKANKSLTAIKDLFRALSMILEGETKSALETFTNLELFGKEGGQKKDPPPRGFQTTNEGRGTEKIIRLLSGKKGVRRNLGSLATSLNKIGELIGELFIAPINLPSVNAGQKLPFAKSGNLRIISTLIELKGGQGRISRDGFLPYKIINQKMVESQNEFVKPSKLRELIPFLNDLNRGGIFGDKKKTLSLADDFVETLVEIYATSTKNNDKIEKLAQREIASIFGAINRITNKKIITEYGDFDADEEYNKMDISNASEVTSISTLIDALEDRREEFTKQPQANKKLIEAIDDFLSEAKKLIKSDIYYKLLEAHDSLRILKGKSIYYGTMNEDNFEHVETMLIKMQSEYNLDMAASELVGVVNEIDSFDNISKAYGISSEHVYLIKANFRWCYDWWSNRPTF